MVYSKLIAIKVDIYIVKIGVVCTATFVRPTMAFYQSVATVFRYIPSNMVNVDDVLNEHAMF